MTAKVIAISNYKGGVGKTTLTANLGALLAKNNNRVLLIDLDGQASLSLSFVDHELLNELTNQSCVRIFSYRFLGEEINYNNFVFDKFKLNNTINNKSKNNFLSLIPSSFYLTHIDSELSAELAGVNSEQIQFNFFKIHNLLKNFISPLKDNFDYILLDCPPNFNIISKNAFIASDYILIPVKPDHLSVYGVCNLIKYIDDIVKDYNKFLQNSKDKFNIISPKLAGIICTMVQIIKERPIEAMAAQMNRLTNLGPSLRKDNISPDLFKYNNGPYLFDNYMRENNNLFFRAPMTGIPVVGQQDNANPVLNKVKNDFNQILDELLDQIK
ncbi:MAG: AAA family ATPase [Deltaproteobacteria bacterium]|jgi:chromosome partitioning protein|nr:AAA family ATPase [Deltaproteobacteria bacterium]